MSCAGGSSSDSCVGTGSVACGAAEALRKAPQTMGPAVCGDLDTTGNVVVGPCGEDLCAVHEPLDPCDYRNSPMARLQSVVDNARRISHTIGLRPYRVFLVWRKRDRRQVFQEFRRQELIPVHVKLDSYVTDRLELQAVGIDSSESATITQVSPNQVDENTLKGLIDGKILAADEEFFYEVVREGRCNGDQPARIRFTLGSTPWLNAEKFQWELGLLAQDNPRGANGEDQTVDFSRAKRRLEVLRR